MQIHNKKMDISFFFLSLSVLSSLIVSFVSFLNLAFSTLNKRFPDILNADYIYGYSTYDYEGMRASLATLIIFFPAFLIIFYFWNKKANKGVVGINETIKKWLIYLIIFLSSLVCVIDLVILIRYFLAGEITSRFILKVLITLIVSLFVGIYFVFKLKGKKKIFRVFDIDISAFIKSIIFVLLLISFSFYVMGSPKSQRLLRFDQKRIDDLQSIQSQIINYWQQKEKLPDNLNELANPMGWYKLPFPPKIEKGEEYEYIIKDEENLIFELCATFEKEMPKGWKEYDYGTSRPFYSKGMDMAVSSYPYPYYDNKESWDHSIGRTCFERKIDKDIYKPFKDM